MEIQNAQFLTLNQKIRIALSVFAIYWPIRQYLRRDYVGWETIEHDWFIWLVELVVTVLYFTFWLNVTEWIEQRFVGFFPTRFLGESKLPAKLTTLLIAGLLAVLFNSGYGALWRSLYHALDRDDRQWEVRRDESGTRHTSHYWGRDTNSQDTQTEKINTGLVVMALLSAYYLAANRRSDQQLQELRVNAEQLKREATQAQLVALKNQVNPHFLFNSLSILSALVEIDTKLSVQFIDRLARAYRYVLEQREIDKVSLATELEFLDAYEFLLNIRFDGKVKVLHTVSAEQAGQVSIAPLTLQLLLENAVKHNQMSEEQPLTVSIYVEGDELIISNPIQLRTDPQNSTGVGLQNIKNRYRLLTERPVVAAEVAGFFVVKLPLLS